MIALRPPATMHAIGRFLRTPKGITFLVLALFSALGLFVGGGKGVDTIVAAVTAAALMDLAIVRMYHGRWEFPGGAILTGLIVAMVVRTQEPLTVATTAAIAAILGKHLLRTHWSNVFNPAAFGLVAVALLFASGESWWGALPDSGVVGLVLLLLAGVFIANHINKLPLVLAFLAAFACLSTLESFLGHSTQVAELFRTPDLQATLFFAFFMLADPPTCPTRYEDQIMFGAICALVSYVVFMAFGPDYFLLAGLLAANAWESSRRLVIGRLHSSPNTAGGPFRFAVIALAGLLACVLPLGASASSQQSNVAASKQTSVVGANPTPNVAVPREARRERDQEDDERGGLVLFAGSSFSSGWRLSSRQFPGEELEILSSGQVQLLERETRQIDFQGTTDARPSQGRGAMHIFLQGKGRYAGINQNLDGTFEIRGQDILFTSRLSRSSPER